MIVLYNPPSNAQRKPVLPMSLLALGAVLEDRYEYLIVDGNRVRDPVATLAAVIGEHEATVLAVTVMPGPQLYAAVPACRELKRRFPSLTVVWGGYFPTQHYEPCLRADFVDVVVRGHGEFVFLAVLDAIARGESIHDIAGVATRVDGAIVSAPRADIPHPDELPAFPYHRLDLEAYVRATFMGRRTLPHHSSYGCPFFCNFCAVVNLVDGKWLPESAERTADTVRRLVQEWRLDAIEFYDNNFFVHEKRTAAFAEQIVDLSIGWWGESRIDTMLKYSDRTWDLLRASGLRMVFLGAESGSDATLKRMRKGGTATAQKTLDIAARTRDLGIIPEFSFVLGNPPEPERDAAETLEFIRKVKRVNADAEIILYMYTPVPLAGELYDQAKASGFRFPDTLDEWVSSEWREFSQRRSSRVPWLEDPLRRRVRDFERVLNARYPTATDPSLGVPLRSLLRLAGGWRYRTRTYAHPLELRLLQRLIRYQRPETAGF
jgi:hypothetical protein